MNVNFKQCNWSIFIISAFSTHNAYFNIITCWAAEIHTEPWWSVVTSAACAFMTIHCFPSHSLSFENN